MVKETGFITKRYKWGWSVWLKTDNRKILLASKLQSNYDVHKLITNLN
jgi:hypothetical protein